MREWGSFGGTGWGQSWAEGKAWEGVMWLGFFLGEYYSGSYVGLSGEYRIRKWLSSGHSDRGRREMVLLS